LIDSTKGKRVWKSARDLYMGITFKGKLLVKEQGSRKYLVVMPKVLEATGVKVFDEQGESVVVEEMLITSAINVNAEKLLGMI
jgi:hypothetical protein